MSIWILVLALLVVLALAPPFRYETLGVGCALHLLSSSRRLGYDHVRLAVHQANSGYLQLYRSGVTIPGRRTFQVDDTDAVTMSFELDRPAPSNFSMIQVHRNKDGNAASIMGRCGDELEKLTVKPSYMAVLFFR